MVYSADENAFPDDGFHIAPERVMSALNELLNNPGFKASARNKRFLRYVVEETLAGRSGKIKSYVIAVDVFGRSARFDPQKDPIVRIEAARLRAAIELYYASCGWQDEIRFLLPKGGYVPAIEMRSDHPTTLETSTLNSGKSPFVADQQP
jgi:hypothetical protein